MRAQSVKHGVEELRTARRGIARHIWIVAFFSFFANLLMLTGPLYMLQVYDRVLSSGSVETLVALSLLMVFLFVMMGLFDLCRGRIMQRAGAQFFHDLQERVFHAVLRRAAVLPDAGPRRGLGDLESVQRLIGAPVVLAVFDLPWTPIFFAAIFLFHPLLGVLALGGAAVLILLALGNQVLSRRQGQAADQGAHAAEVLAAQVYSEAQVVRALGMRRAAFARWHALRSDAMAEDLSAQAVGSTFSTMTKTLRLMLQSAMLGLGAWLVIGGQMTPGGMIAGSILLGRALAPIESILTQWPIAQQATRGWRGLVGLLDDVPAEDARLSLPDPRAQLRVEGVTIVPPGVRTATIRSLSFEIEPGQAVGVIGPSGSGKSTLARALVGQWPAAGGVIRLDGAALDQYGPDALGRHIGYQPQTARLFDATIAQNIARLEREPDADAVIRAAQAADAHELILGLPQGYDTPIQADQPRLSGGQMQRICLARALFGDPALLILDEPNANLDNNGSVALNAAIRRFKGHGGSVLIMAHRPAAIQECDMILVLDGGLSKAFGPKDEVLAGMVKNAKDIRSVPAVAGMR